MPLSDGIPSSPPGPSSTPEDAIAYYKAQYESLEAELADFQSSSKELEAELEKDIEAAEQRERRLKEKADNLAYEVDEWKTKYKQSKAEGNAAQNALQKEITTLRDTSRTFQMRLRDIEVANDDYERQQRNTESSLEDLESKYSVAIERSVMLEEEFRVGEQEREALRIETQRLRDELSDLRIEAEITKEKLRKAEEQGNPRSKLSLLEPVLPSASPRSELSPTTSDSTPSFDTPTGKTESSSGRSDTHTPPSPISEKASNGLKPFKTPSLPKTRLSITANNATPRPSTYALKPPGHSRRPSVPLANGRSTPSHNFRSSISRSNTARGPKPGLTQSNSIYHLHNLQGKMQRLTERVHTAKSKLPGPINTPPKSSPRANPTTLSSNIPATVTMRSGRKRANGSTIIGPESLPDTNTPSMKSRSSRQSLTASMLPPTSTPSRTAKTTTTDHKPIAPPLFARPSSRASATSTISSSRANPIPLSTHPTNSSSRHQQHPYQPGQGHSRPGSRASMSMSHSASVRTPLGHRHSQHFTPNATTDRIRPKSSLGNYGTDGACDERDQPLDEDGSEVSGDYATPTPRRTTFGRRTSEMGSLASGNKRLSVSRLPAPTGSAGGRFSLGGGSGGGGGGGSGSVSELSRPGSSRSNKSGLVGLGEGDREGEEEGDDGLDEMF